MTILSSVRRHGSWCAGISVITSTRRCRTIAALNGHHWSMVSRIGCRSKGAAFMAKMLLVSIKVSVSWAIMLSCIHIAIDVLRTIARS